MNKNHPNKQFLPCPFCGKEISIQICDREGNFHKESYINDPWSGLSFAIIHPAYMYDNNDKKIKLTSCPIAHHDDDIIGCTLYDSKTEAAAAWNSRVAQYTQLTKDIQ